MLAYNEGASSPAEDSQMNTVGIFAGRGDVILSMSLALMFGVWVGWQLRSFVSRWQNRKRK